MACSMLVGCVVAGGWRWGNTSVLQMRVAKSFRNEGELMKMI